MGQPTRTENRPGSDEPTYRDGSKTNPRVFAWPTWHLDGQLSHEYISARVLFRHSPPLPALACARVFLGGPRTSLARICVHNGKNGDLRRDERQLRANFLI